jgi:hypothetical protein
MSTSADDFVSPGKVIAVADEGRTVVFAPRGTSYELHLRCATPYAGPVNSPVEAVIRLLARKVYTVPSGGNFVTPIMGPPRIVQGRVRAASDKQLIIRAGANFAVELPAADTAIDLGNGGIALNTMVNVVALPGATFELAVPGQAVDTKAETSELVQSSTRSPR